VIIERGIRNREHGLRRSGEGGGSGGVDPSFEHADGYVAKRNVPHSGIEPQHAKST